MKKIFLIAVLAGLIGFGSHFFFKSRVLEQYLENVNTFHGQFKDLSSKTAVESLRNSYLETFQDFYTHLPRTPKENADYYALFLAAIISVSLGVYFFSNQAQLKTVGLMSLVILFGMFARFFLAYHTSCNHDVVSWYVDKHILDAGQNIFAETDRYNYSPLWFWILKGLSKVNQMFSFLPYMFIVRFFLALVDLVTLFVVVKISNVLNLSSIKSAALFFLNPISIIITGYHGQFDNIPILFLLLAIYIYLKRGNKGFFLGWIFITIGFIAKHEILQQLLIYFRCLVGEKKKVVFWFLASTGFFLLCFIPYWAGGFQRIIQNVFLYGGMMRPYGLIFFDFLHPVVAQIHKILFISFLLIWPFFNRSQNLLKSSLMGMILFLIFTSGISVQQFVLPVALGALLPSTGFALYSVVTTAFLFGNFDELKMISFNWMRWNYVWFSVLIWYVLENRKQRDVSV